MSLPSPNSQRPWRRLICAAAALGMALTSMIAVSSATVADAGIPSDYPMQPFAHPDAGPTDGDVPTSRAPRATPGRGGLIQLTGKAGCLKAKPVKRSNCTPARALKGPGPFMGSNAIAISKDGKFAYVAASTSDAVVVLARNKKTGVLSQPKGRNGCVANNGKSGCRKAIGLDGPNSLALSSDGKSLYVTSRDSNSITVFNRNKRNGSLSQVAGAQGCVAGSTITGCASGIGLKAPDVVVISRDGRNVYLGSFLGNAVAAFSRDQGTGGLTQLSGSSACIGTGASECAEGLALKAPEGMAINNEGTAVYVATAVSNAVAVLTRNSDGSLSQATDGSGCITTAPETGCTTGRELAGANALAFSPNGRNLYATTLFSGSLLKFDEDNSSLRLPPTLGACTAFLGDAGCRYGRMMRAPEGVTVSPDGRSVYVAAFGSDAIDVFERNTSSGSVVQKGGTTGCVKAKSANCQPGRELDGVSSIAVSPDNRFVYSTSFHSDAVNIFRRVR